MLKTEIAPSVFLILRPQVHSSFLLAHFMITVKCVAHDGLAWEIKEA